MKRKIAVWALYDFANSFVFITFLIYFSKWLVVDKGFADSLYNGTFILGSIALLFLAPALGKKADQSGFNHRYLAGATVLCFVGFALTTIGAIAGWNLFLVALLFAVGSFFYQLAFVFYNPLLENISTPQNRGKVSGVGFLGNYTGQICALLLALPLVSGSISLGVEPIIAPLLVSTILFLVFALPLLLSKDVYKRKEETSPVPAKEDHKALLKIIYRTTPLFLFLLSFFFFSDAVTTFTNNFSIFTANVFHTTDEQIGILVLAALLMAGVGAGLSGWLIDKFSAVKIMSWILTLWIVMLVLAAVAPSYNVFFAFALIGGLLVGGTWSTARALLLSVTPPGMTNYVFGWYAISERAATLLGPLVWSLVLVVGGYRWALFSLAGFQAISILLIFKVLKASETGNLSS